MEKQEIVITSGTYDPLSIEDLNLLKYCKRKGNWLIVGLHSDKWMETVEGGIMQPFRVRREILLNLRLVDEVFGFDDTDGTLCKLLKVTKACYPHTKITYISGMNMNNTPELKIAGVKFEQILIKEK